MNITIVSDGQMPTPSRNTHGLGRAAHDLGKSLVYMGHRVQLVGAVGSQMPGGSVVEACKPALGAVIETEEAIRKAALGTKYDLLIDVSHAHGAAYGDLERSVILHQDTMPLVQHPNIVFISHAQRDRCTKGWKDGSKVRVILNKLWEPPIPEPPKKRYDVALFLGNLVPHKGAHYAIELAHIMGVPIWVAGRMLDKDYADKVRGMCLQGKGLYIGPLDEKEKYRVLSQVRMVIACPNSGYIDYHETAQLVVAEAALCGTPVLGSKNGGIVDYITDEVGATGANLREMLQKWPEVWDKPREGIAEYARGKFLMKNNAHEWREVVEDFGG